ncbi:MAG: tRNA pseudouridine(38-40) synthase TruA [Heliobacteriaceae bacterium]|nr:tRNA pseudouridine(38-40) synthase TruA [Heliobacteriaceae bacterium]MDD4587996.1 tRNA pseudouridine(38-40) synthase TruA [Heliobacteriaceae bacterium]
MNGRRIKLIVAYDGTNYHGFQTQGNPYLPTIQDELAKAVRQLTGETVKITGAGRTDAGVHARGQVVDFLTVSRIPDERFSLAMNALLPRDIAVTAAKTVDPDFNARFAAAGKHYRYTILNQRVPSPFHRRYSFQVYPPLRVAAMQEAAQHLIGTLNFRAFCGAGSTARTFVRTIWSCRVTLGEENQLVLDVTGDGFLLHMVRIIAGTLVAVGKGKFSPGDIPRIIASRDRTKAGMTAPPQGLCLMKVWY